MNRRIMMELLDEAKGMPLSEEISFQEELSVNQDLEQTKYYDKEVATNHVLDTVIQKANQNIEKEVTQDKSLPSGIDKTMVKDVVKNVVELALKLVLKKRFHVSFSTFEDAKKAINGILNGDTKTAVKSASDVALSEFTGIDASTKSAIKTMKNKVIDQTIDGSKHEIAVKQTKLINRLQENCTKFEEALGINDVKNIKKIAKTIEKDMKEIMPIRDAISQAQVALDKYELWKNNGNRILSDEEIELIEKMNQSA